MRIGKSGRSTRHHCDKARGGAEKVQGQWRLPGKETQGIAERYLELGHRVPVVVIMVMIDMIVLLHLVL